MCGIAGILSPAGAANAGELRATVLSMTNTLEHRGPDDSGLWLDAGAGVALGHRRLSIIDLSPEGHQPMVSGSGRYVIVFNGEIYNHRELRRELQARPGAAWRGHSDTEVMLAAIEAWGLTESLRRFTGMFALALWDREERALFLCRDRLGKKPLYYGWAGRSFIFGSELKALRACPEFTPRIDRNSLALYLRHNCIPEPYSIYTDIRKLPPSGVIRVSGSSVQDRSPSIQYYWSARDVAVQGTLSPYSGPASEAVTSLEALLKDAVKLRMEADVPLGAFLSGGVDSSLVVALMQAQSNRPIKTFTIGFHEAAYNEAIDARAVAGHLGTEHTELYVTPQETLAVIPLLPGLYDEPFSDSSQIPTYLVSKLARTQVTVSLSGDGGDELFGGYNRYTWAKDLWAKTGRWPGILRKSAVSLTRSLSPMAWDRLFQTAGALLPGRLRQRTPGDKMHKLADALACTSPEDIYLRLVSHWDDPASIVPDSLEPATKVTDPGGRPELGDFSLLMMYLDMVTYLPDDILVKVDRASMGVSLEARAPLLDHRVAEFAWRLPLGMKIKQGKGKWILRQLLYQYVPEGLVERPKMGFGVPIDAWLRGPLREWAESLLAADRLKSEGFLDPRPIRKAWAEHLSGRYNRQHRLWDILMFQAWKEYWQGHE